MTSTVGGLERWFRAHLDLQRRYQMTRGCPLGTVANEITADNELVRQDLGLIFEVMKSKLAGFFIREKAAGRLSQAAREQDLADFCLAAVQGAMLLGKIGRSDEPAEAAIAEALAHLRAYVPAPATA